MSHCSDGLCSTSVCVYALNTHSLTRWTRAHYCGLIFALEAAASVYPSCSVNCGSSRLRGEAGRSPSVQRPRFCSQTVSYSKEAHCLQKATPVTRPWVNTMEYSIQSLTGKPTDGKIPSLLVRGSSNCRLRFLLLTLTNSQPALDQSGVFHLPNHALFNYLQATHISLRLKQLYFG